MLKPIHSYCYLPGFGGYSGLHAGTGRRSSSQFSRAMRHFSFVLISSILQNIPKDDRHELIKCKEYLKEAEARREELDLRIDANRAALFVLRMKGEKNADRCVVSHGYVQDLHRLRSRASNMTICWLFCLLMGNCTYLCSIPSGYPIRVLFVVKERHETKQVPQSRSSYFTSTKL